MSLDFYLVSQEPVEKTCECYGTVLKVNDEVLFTSNITDNLTSMASATGIYNCLWHPERIKNNIIAAEIIQPLTDGLRKLKENPEVYRKLNSPNGWGIYEHFVPFVEHVLQACKDYPNALVKSNT